MFCDKCGSKIDGNAKFCQNCGASIPHYSKQEITLKKNDNLLKKLSKINLRKNKTALVIILLCVVIILSTFFINEMFMKDLEPRQGFELVKSENGISLYHNSKDNVYMEIKDADNSNTTYSKDDVLGEKANVTCWFKKFTITCYKPIDKGGSSQTVFEQYSNANPEAVVALATMDAYDSVTKVEPYHLYLKGMLRDNNLKAIDEGIVDLYGNLC